MILEPANVRQRRIRLRRKLRGSKIRRNRDVQSQVPAFYIHIPFCKKKCNYCDFVSYAGKEKLIDRYVEAICAELSALTPAMPRLMTPLPAGEGYFPKTIFFGGGTPTLLEPKHFEEILATIPLSPWERGKEGVRALEISTEANPGTADLAKLKALRSLGINRLSIGVQSFNDKHLKALGRIHGAETAKRFYHDARAAGFDNINLDLIFALPGQTLEEWKIDLTTAIELKPEHLSTYNLQIEEGTPFWEMFKEPSPAVANRRTLSQRERVTSQADMQSTFSPWEKVPSSGKADEGLKLPSEDLELAMYEHTIETLTAAGYKHYEISNFAKPGRECQHNLTYWHNENYLGIGSGAHSHMNGKRWSNPNCIEEYLRSVTVTSTKPVSVTVNGNGRQRQRKTIRASLPSPSPFVPDQHETLFLGLRLLDGLAVENFKDFEKEVAELIADGLLTEQSGNYKLTRQGLYLANRVFEKFV